MCGSISKPCKNNKDVVINQRQPPPSSAFERHQIALEKERESVQVNFVSCAIGTRSALTYHHYSVMIIVLFIPRVHLLELRRLICFSTIKKITGIKIVS